MTAFGLALIGLTYLWSHAFHTSGQAVICLMSIYMFSGTVTPTLFLTYLVYTGDIHAILIG